MELNEQINKLSNDIKETAEKLKKLNYQYNKLLNNDKINKMNDSIGKYYRGKFDGTGTITLFKPKKVDIINSICIKGNSYKLHYYAIGDVNFTYSNNIVLSVSDFFDDYVEISKEEYNRLVKDILNWCHFNKYYENV